MLLLCSNGLSSKSLMDQTKARLNHYKRAALVVTADPVYKENNYHVPRCIRELESLGLLVDILDLDHQPAELLTQYDVVEFIGGNPYYLLNALRNANCFKILDSLSQNKLLIGWSAAAFVFGPTLELVDRYSPEMNAIGLTDLTGLSLTERIVLPHYSKFLNIFDHFEETCQEFENGHHVNVIRLNDGDGVFISHSTIEICKGESA